MALKPEEVYAILKKQIQSGGGTPGPAGVGIQKIEKTGTDGLVDTYTITYTNGQASTYTVTNGANGKDGSPGAKGDPGQDGITPTIGETGNWYLGEEDTGKPSRGEKGDPGQKGDPGDKGDPGATGATPNIQIGTVQTLEPGQDATASMSGTPENPLLNLGIPKGEKGDPGEDAESGDSYTLPIMSDTQLGGGKAVAKTDEDVPVAVDTETGQLFVPTYPSVGGNGVSGWVKVGSVTSETDGEILTISGIGSATKIKVVLKVATESDNKGLRFYFGNDPYKNYFLMASSVSDDFGYTIFEMEITNIDGVNILNVPFIVPPKHVVSTNVNVSPLSNYQGFISAMEIDSFDTFSVTSVNSQLKSGCIMEVYKWQ